MRRTNTERNGRHDSHQAGGRATQAGFLAIVLWATLALLSASVQRLPPFELLALTFAVGGALGLGRALLGGQMRAAFRQRPAVWALGVGTFFGYHSLYFVALKHAPAVHVSLIAYLWPLLLVLFSGRQGGAGRSILGATMGLAGVMLLLLRDGTANAGHADGVVGYVAALACAFIWSGYSALNRRFPEVPPVAVTAFCLATALLGSIVHLALEPTVVPDAREALAMAALGLGPIGAAFFFWDHGTKHGDLRMLGVLSYATPLLSTLLLVAFGIAHFSWPVALACAFITGGAFIASRKQGEKKVAGGVDPRPSGSTPG